MKLVCPLYSLPSQVEYSLSNPLVTGDNGLLPDPGPYAEAIFTATQEITTEHEWPVSNTLSSLDSQVGDPFGLIYQAQPTPVQTPANYSGNHHLDS